MRALVVAVWEVLNTLVASVKGHKATLLCLEPEAHRQLALLRRTHLKQRACLVSNVARGEVYLNGKAIVARGIRICVVVDGYLRAV